jgi:SagB-type dehydrogenase family enzyme
MQHKLSLPPPLKKGSVSVEEAIDGRSSVRAFKDKALTLSQVSQLLWAAQGARGVFRTCPSAGATYPLHLLLCAKNVEGLSAGVYEYISAEHALSLIYAEDVSKALARSCLGQAFIEEASVNLVLAAVFERTTSRYGRRGIMYVHIEVGHAAENVYLQAYSLGLATCAVGAFYEEEVQKVVHAPKQSIPLYIMPIGYRR